jgi:hypothetical protein
VKDVTSTSFGLIIAYLLPGLTGLYSLSFWFPRVQDLFSKFGSSESNVGLFLLVLLASIIASLQISVLRYWIFERCICHKIKLDPALLRNLGNKDKHTAFRTVIDEQYRYHQFWGGMFVVQAPLFYGWITTTSWIATATFTNFWSIAALWGSAALVELATFFAAKEAWERYVKRAHSVLIGDSNAERVPPPPSQESNQEGYGQKGSSQESSQKGSGQKASSQKTPEITDEEEIDDED